MRQGDPIAASELALAEPTTLPMTTGAARPRTQARPLDYIELILAMFLWGSLYPAGKPVLEFISPTQLALSRAVIASLILLGLVVIRGNGSRILAEIRNRPLDTIVLGFLSFFLSSYLAMASLQYLPASVGGLLINTSPLWLSLAVVALKRPDDSVRMLTGALVALLGVALVLFRDVTDVSSLLTLSFDIRGVALASFNAIVIAVSNVWSRKIMPGRDPIAVTGLSAFWAVWPFVIITFFGGGIAPIFGMPFPELGILLYIGIGCSAMNFALFNHVIKRIPAERASMFQYLSPLISAILGFSLLGEPITIPLVAGGVAIVFGLWLTQERR